MISFVHERKSYVDALKLALWLKDCFGRRARSHQIPRCRGPSSLDQPEEAEALLKTAASDTDKTSFGFLLTSNIVARRPFCRTFDGEAPLGKS